MIFFIKLIILIVVNTIPLSVFSKPCEPNDPTGNNPNNLCFLFPPPGINSDSFVQGNGLPVRELPTVQNPQGNVILKPTGFWTGSSTSGSNRVITDSSGNQYSLPK